MHANRYEYINRLYEMGCKEIGKGLYSNVFSVPGQPDKAIKVADHDGWPEYIAWATRNGHAGKFAPKVYSLKFKGDFYVAIMERLVCTMNECSEVACLQTLSWNLIDRFGTAKGAEDIGMDLQDYIAELQSQRLANDLHRGNFMIRSDGSLVVTDPLSNSGSLAPFRIKSGEFT